MDSFTSLAQHILSAAQDMENYVMSTGSSTASTLPSPFQAGAPGVIPNGSDGVNGYSNGVNGHSDGVNGVNGHSDRVNGYGNGVNGYSDRVNGYGNGMDGHSNGVNGHSNAMNGHSNSVNGHSNCAAQAPNGASTNGSYHLSSACKLPADLEERRSELIDATHKLQNQTRGPGTLIYEHLYRFTDIASWLFVIQFDISSHIPLNAEISYSELGAKINVERSVVRRYLENLMVSGYFEESSANPGHVRHTPDSAAFANDPNLLATVSLLHELILPSIIKSVEALKTWPLSQETNESGFCIAHDTKDTMYQMLSKNPKKAQRFGTAMSSFTKESFSGQHPLSLDFDWSEFDNIPGATVVDLGGSLGHLSFNLARATKQMKFVIQDLPPTAEAGKNGCPEDMKARVSFEPYDFLTEQKPREKPFNAVIMANSLQNWPDKYVVKIIRNQTSVLAKGGKFLIYERPLSNLSDTRWSRRVARCSDMLMGSLLNGKLRTPEEWRHIFAEADSRFKFIGVRAIGGDKGLAEAVFEG
ncbi:Sterigmatocystin 8-O-methyltransferase [Venturia nashicola]|nr:Sterigmatocystin 8-O-methyltransferase [Venturia nashicola]